MRWLLALLTAVMVLTTPTAAHARKVRIRGGAKLLAQATFVRDRSVLELRGQLTDDARAPLAQQWVELSVEGGLVLTDARACPEPQVNVAPLEGEPGKQVETAAGGVFCLRWAQPPAKGSITLSYRGDKYHGGTELQVSFDRSKPQRLATTLRFDPRPLVMDLDKDQLVVSGVLDLALTTVHASRRDRAVRLLDEDGKAIADGKTAGDGRVRLLVDPNALGEPGSGKLKLEFAGDDALAPSSDEQPVTRRTTVRMRLAGDVEPADAGDTAEVALELDTKRGPVKDGVVEALLGGNSLGSATVVDGKANLVVLLDPKLEEEAILSVRYLPASPFYKPGSVLTVEVPIAPPSLALRIALSLVVLAAAVWITLSWRRSKHTPTLRGDRPALTPGVHVVKASDGGRTWIGAVLDAHDGRPIADAMVRVRAPTLEVDDTVLELRTDAHGAFSFELEARPDGAELAAEAQYHAEERRPLPPAGELRIALITRRRALLRRFVQWAQFRGVPYDRKPEPTPEQVVAVARQQQRPEVVDWARAVEEVAFGPDQVDAGRDAELRDLEPGP